MARPTTIDDEQLLLRLMRAFRRTGFEGATLTALAEATGLKKASLYHRFPGGKEQMAREVLAAAERWLDESIIAPLTGAGTPADRIEGMVAELDRFYDGGRQACLLNVLAAPMGEAGPFADMVRAAFEKWIAALARTVEEAGLDRGTAERRARRAIALVEGGLVLARGLGTTAPFRQCLEALPAGLLAASPADDP